MESVLCIAREVDQRADESARRHRELMEREQALQETVDRLIEGRAVKRRQDAGAALLRTLSFRETQIVRLLAEGKTNQQIGDALGLSPGTVRNYVSRLLPKLGATDRTHAVALAVGWGLLD